MQTSPPSVGNNVKLNPLNSTVNSVAYNNNFISLKTAEPSLGLPSGYTLTQPNSVHYFPVFAIADSYKDSRKFTGNNTLTFVNKNLGYNTTNPTYNIDISGNFRALSAYILNFSAKYIIPASGINTLFFNYSSGVYFNNDLYLNNNTYIKSLTTDSLYTNFLSAYKEISTTIYTIYNLTGAYVDHDVIIAGDLTATNVFASSSVITPYISSISAFFTNLTAEYLTVNNTLSVNGDIYGNQIYGKIQIDPFSQLYYNDKNQLSIEPNQNCFFAVRPSDGYSTDNVDTPRTVNGYSENTWLEINEDANVLKPYFKNLQPVFDYIYKNGIVGKDVTIYIDEDIIEGEDKENYYTVDKSGDYAGCSITGNLTAIHYSTEWLGLNHPSLTAAGMLGGDFIWAADNSIDATGVFSYLDLPPLEFNNINICGRFEIGSKINSNNTLYYSSTGRSFTENPRKISFRTYVCTNPTLSAGEFKKTGTAQLSTWNHVRTKSTVQGRQVEFSHDTNLTLNNLCFEFITNSDDSTALVFYNGKTTVSNLTVSLLGNGVYSYGSLYLNSPNVKFQVCGTELIDPTMLSVPTWNTWNTNGNTFKNPRYFPGYGMAIVGNPSVSNPTIVNFGTSTSYTGFINVNNGALFDNTDYNVARISGRYSYLNSSIILDGKFNASSLYKIGDHGRIQGCEYLFKTNGFALSSKHIKPNNQTVQESYILSINDIVGKPINFKFINYAGSFSTLNVNYYGYKNWAFTPNVGLITNFKNSYLSVNNGNIYDSFYVFNGNNADLSQSVFSMGHINTLVPSRYNSESQIQYVGVSDIMNYDLYYQLNSPIYNNFGTSYTLNFYTSSVR
jgi:hypothetical protein